MYKVILTAKKRPDLTREQFIDYYDNRHVPFMHRLLSVGAAVHRRNFVVRDAAAGGLPDDGFDVITEVIYEDRETAEATLRQYADPEIRRLALEDEGRFLLPGSLRAYVVEVHETVFRPLPPG